MHYCSKRNTNFSGHTQITFAGSSERPTEPDCGTLAFVQWAVVYRQQHFFVTFLLMLFKHETKYTNTISSMQS
jgi:hypothetical protein